MCLGQRVVESNTINAFKSGLGRTRQVSIGLFTVIVRKAVRPHLFHSLDPGEITAGM